LGGEPGRKIRNNRGHRREKKKDGFGVRVQKCRSKRIGGAIGGPGVKYCGTVERPKGKKKEGSYCDQIFGSRRDRWRNYNERGQTGRGNAMAIK